MVAAAAVFSAGVVGMAAPASAAPPPNDDFANAIALFDDDQGLGSTILATVEPGEPKASCVGTQMGTVWYRYTAHSGGRLSIDVETFDADHALVVYAGDAVDALTELDCEERNSIDRENDDLDDLEVASVDVTAGTSYSIAVTPVSAADAAGFDIYLFFDGTPPPPWNDDFANAWTAVDNSQASGDTTSATVESGEVQPSCLPTRTGTTWHRFNATAAGRLTVDLRSTDGDHGMAIYTGAAVNALTEAACIERDDIGIDDFEVGTVTVTAGTSYSIAVMAVSEADAGSYNALFSFEPPPPPPPANDNFKAKVNVKFDPITGALEEETRAGTTVWSTLEPGEPIATCGSVGGTVWYRYKPLQDGTLLLDASAENASVVVSVFRGRYLTSLEEQACFVSNFADDFQAQVPVVANEVYAIAVASTASDFRRQPAFVLTMRSIPVPTPWDT